MIEFEAIERAIRTGLEEYLASKGYTCPVIVANQHSPAPSYPYTSYTITTVKSAHKGTHSVGEDGTRYKQLVQTWSFTVQSDKETEAVAISLHAHDWFDLVGNVYMSDNGIVAQHVGSISGRDNMLSIQYEHRKGFDVDFLLVYAISKEDSENAGYIESATVTRTID